MLHLAEFAKGFTIEVSIADESKGVACGVEALGGRTEGAVEEH